MKLVKIHRTKSGQTITLPRDCWFDVDEVVIRRMGSAVILFPKEKAWDIMREACGKVDDDFMKDRDQPKESDKRHSF